MAASPYQAGLIIVCAEVVVGSCGCVCLCMRALMGAGEATMDSWVRRTQLVQKHSEQPIQADSRS